MVRSHLALLCASLLVWSSLAYASGGSQAKDIPRSNLKEQFTQIPSGSVVEIRLATKQKLRGRLGSISDAGFDLQYTEAGKIVTKTLSFDDVQSVKLMGHGWSTGKKILVGTLIGAGVLFLIGLIGCLATGCTS